MTHLGELTCALIDARLDGASRDRARAHLAGCTQCRRQLVDLRSAKTLLAIADTPVEASPELLARLRLIAEDTDRDAGAEYAARVSGLPTPWRSIVGRSTVGRSIAGRSTVGRSIAGRSRSFAAAGFAASVVVGFAGTVSGSSAPIVAARSTGSPATDISQAIATMAPIDVSVGKPSGRAAVSVVYRRP